MLLCERKDKNIDYDNDVNNDDKREKERERERGKYDNERQMNDYNNTMTG